ncbi:MAG TPA: hypothetical protein VFP27_06760 [Mycobacterium sp.]|nr:hypothetical protein [Mycobacterium sp.]
MLASRPRALDSTVLNDAGATQGHDHPARRKCGSGNDPLDKEGVVCSLRQADRYRLREFAYNESDGAPDEKESRPKQQPPGYQACMMAR